MSKRRIVLGARVPVILTSRAGSPQAPHIVSCAIALLLMHSNVPTHDGNGDKGATVIMTTGVPLARPMCAPRAGWVAVPLVGAGWACQG